MTRPDLDAVLRALGACGPALTWAAGYGAAWTTALAACTERRWLTWLAGTLMRRGHLRREAIVLCACACARTALRHVPAGEDRPLRAIETAERWCRGEATVDEVWAAQREARGAAVVAYAAYAAAAAAADAAADDADAAAAAAALAAAYAADAALAAADAYAAYAAAADDADADADAADAAADDAAADAAADDAAADDAYAVADRFRARREARARAEAELLAITRRELGDALLDGLTAYAATLPAAQGEVTP